MKFQINIRARIGCPRAPVIPTTRQANPRPSPCPARPRQAKPKGGREGSKEGSVVVLPSCPPAYCSTLVVAAPVACLPACLPCLQQWDRSATRTLASCWQWSSVVLWCSISKRCNSNNSSRSTTRQHRHPHRLLLTSHLSLPLSLLPQHQHQQQPTICAPVPPQRPDSFSSPGCKLHQIVSGRRRRRGILV